MAKTAGAVRVNSLDNALEGDSRGSKRKERLTVCCLAFAVAEASASAVVRDRVTPGKRDKPSRLSYVAI